MIEPVMLAALTGIVGAIGAMIWSYLMASKVAAPRAAAKSRLLLVSILTGATKEDAEILETIRETLIRPEVDRSSTAMPTAEALAAAIEFPEVSIDVDRFAEIVVGKLTAEQGVKQKALLAELAKLDPEIAAVREALDGEFRQGRTATDIALMRFVNHDLPPAFKKRYPDAAAYWENAKVLTTQFVEMAREAGMMQREQMGESAPSSAGGSGAHRPGMIR